MNTLGQIAVLLAAATLTSTSVVMPPAKGAFELLILHNNDMHARFEQTNQMSGVCEQADSDNGKCYGGFPRVAHVVKQAREAEASGEGPPVLYLNAGDTYTGTAWFTIYKWKIAAEFVNALRPDAVSLGNHEFDRGVSGLTPFIRNLTCPVLATNLNLTNVPELQAETNLMNSYVFNISGTKVGVVGYLTPNTKFQAIKNDVEFIDEIIALREEVAELKNRGVNIIIALGHSGYDREQEIAEQVEDLDLVIGAHSHTFLWNGTSPDTEEVKGPYPTYVTQASGKSVPVVQAYAFTKYLGRILLNFDSDGNLVSLNGQPILLDNTIPQDPDVLSILDRYRRDIQKVSAEVVGHSYVTLDGHSCEQKECNLGNLITDAMVNHYASLYKGEHWTDAPIAIIQAGGIRTSIGHGGRLNTITKGDLLTVMPFKGNMTAISMNGSVLLQMLEHSVARYNAALVGEFLQYSGVKVTYDISKPVGSRVVEASARCWACDIPIYTKVEERQIYKVIMPDFVSNGGDGYTMLLGLPTVELPYNELICTQTYVKKHTPFFTGIEGRITFVQKAMFINSSSSASQSSILNLLLVITLIVSIQ